MRLDNRHKLSLRPRLMLLTALMCALLTSSTPAGLEPEEGLPVASWEQAREVIGRRSVVCGKVVGIGHTERIHFLNFKQHDREAFTVVIFADSLSKFPDTLETLYLDKLVKVIGGVTLYKNVPQIVVASPDQIKVVDILPESNIPEAVKVEIGDEIVVGTYNVMNLFDDIDDPYHDDEGTPSKPRDEMRQVAHVIREIKADVLALQEVESRGYLLRFVQSMLPDMGYDHIVHYEGNDGRGIDVCLISRIPVGSVVSHRHRVFPASDGGAQTFNRDLLCVELLPVGGQPFEMWVVHLKSNSGGKEENEPIRLGECREIHRLIVERLERDPQAAFILSGDFNDTFDSLTLQTILGDPPRLIAFFDELPPQQRVTYNKEPYRSMIDFLLCSPAMARRFVPHTYTIRSGTVEESGSDHNPVFCRFRKHADVSVSRGGPKNGELPIPGSQTAAATSTAGESRNASASAPSDETSSSGPTSVNSRLAPRWLWALGLSVAAAIAFAAIVQRLRGSTGERRQQDQDSL